MSDKPKSDNQLPSLTGLRGYAAAFVMVAHGSAVLIKFNDYQHPVLPILTSLAGIGMSLFFVLSGFVIHYNYAPLIAEKGRSGLLPFFKARFARLYPLFLLMILVDLAWGASPGWYRLTYQGQWLWYEALPYYLPMVQTWIYKIIGANSLVYQIGPNVPLTWSISTEWFFYCAYPFLLLAITRLKKPLLIGLTLSVYILGLWFLFGNAGKIYPAVNEWGIAHFGTIAGMTPFQDSFVRWVFYFSPYSRITEFILGCLACHLYFKLKPFPVSRIESIIGIALQSAAILLAIFFYREIFIIRSPNFGGALSLVFGLAPVMAFVIFAFARYRSALNIIFENKPILWLGEISYSVYLTHFLILHAFSQFTRPDFSKNAEAVEWTRFGIGIAVVIAASSLSYLQFEVPMRRQLRAISTSSFRTMRTYWEPAIRFSCFVALFYLLQKFITWPGMNDTLSARLEFFL